MEYKTILFSVENNVATIVMNQPKTLNPMNFESMEDILDALNKCAAGSGVKAVILKGAGKAFCGGGDIRFFKEESEKPGFGLGPLVSKVGEVITAIRNLPVPVICAVHSAAAGGGCNLALACDVVIAADNAKFIEAFVNIGLAPDTGGVFTLPRIVGPIRAFELMSTGRPVGAQEALSLGMVSYVCPVEELETRANELAAKYAAGPSMVFARLKKMMNASMYAGFAEYLALESECLDECSKSDDFKEGITAFLEKRKAVYTGK